MKDKTKHNRSQQQAPENDNPVLLLGRIQRPRGVHGELRVTCRGDLLPRMQPGSVLHIYTGESIKDGFIDQAVLSEAVKLESIYPVAHEVISVKLAGLRTPEEAQKYQGSFIGMPLDEAKARFGDPKEPWLFQYIGMALIEEEQEIGRVLRVEESGLQWLVVSAAGKEIMVPMNGPFIESIDFQNNRLVTRGVAQLGMQSETLNEKESKEEEPDQKNQPRGADSEEA